MLKQKHIRQKVTNITAKITAAASLRLRIYFITALLYLMIQAVKYTQKKFSTAVIQKMKFQ